MEASSIFSSENSRRLPWAGLVTLLLVVVFELVHDSGMVWTHLLGRVSVAQDLGASKLVREQMLKRGLGIDNMTPSVLVPGTSRALAGIRNDILSGEIPSLRILQLARPGMEPFQLLSSSIDVASQGPDVALLTISEFDVFRPLRVEPVSDRGAGGTEALAILVDALSPRQVWRSRDSLLRLAAASASDVYRFRGLHRHVWSGKVTEFDLSRFANADSPRQNLGLTESMLSGGAAEPLDPDVVAAILARFPDNMLKPTIEPFQIPMIREIVDGEHARIQAALLRAAVARLVEAQVEVILLETPLHPVTSELYDITLGEDFRELAREIAASPRVTFIRPQTDFEPEDFGDLLHLSASGAEKLTRSSLPELSRILDERLRFPHTGTRADTGKP